MAKAGRFMPKNLLYELWVAKGRSFLKFDADAVEDALFQP